LVDMPHQVMMALVLQLYKMEVQFNGSN